MKKLYKVAVDRTILDMAYVVVEADNPEEAGEQALYQARYNANVNWEQGNTEYQVEEVEDA